MGQTIVSTSGKDAYIARFQDNGMADYKSAEAFINPINKEVNNTISVYPNPTTGVFKVVSVNNDDITEITITDLTGKMVYKTNINNLVNDTEINTDFLNAGTYLLSVATESNNFKLKLLIVK